MLRPLTRSYNPLTDAKPMKIQLIGALAASHSSIDLLLRLSEEANLRRFRAKISEIYGDFEPRGLRRFRARISGVNQDKSVQFSWPGERERVDQLENPVKASVKVKFVEIDQRPDTIGDFLEESYE
ncbi:hypothetical protein ACS0TY_012625 [Phlomoides rotata]